MDSEALLRIMDALRAKAPEELFRKMVTPSLPPLATSAMEKHLLTIVSNAMVLAADLPTQPFQ